MKRLTNHKTPMRTCISCRKCDEKRNMLRIVMNDNQVCIDTKGKMDGRGAYICKDVSCVSNAKKTRALSRVFKTNIGIEIYEEIGKLLENDEKI